MTEAEWVSCSDPDPMVEFLRAKVSDRKLRLFACACCRRIWHSLTSERGRHAVEVTERFADGLASKEELEAAYVATRPAGWGEPDPWDELCAPMHAASGEPALAAARAADLRAARTACIDYPFDVCKGIYDSVRVGERMAQAALLRDIIGNPLRLVSINPSWLSWNDGCVPQLAQAIYEGLRFGDLPILSDALEESGCTDQGILAHCRQTSTHVRGCWVIDRLLGKS